MIPDEEFERIALEVGQKWWTSVRSAAVPPLLPLEEAARRGCELGAMTPEEREVIEAAIIAGPESHRLRVAREALLASRAPKPRYGRSDVGMCAYDSQTCTHLNTEDVLALLNRLDGGKP